MMHLDIIKHYFFILLFLSCVADAMSYGSRFQSEKIPQLSEVKDSRDNGILYEANRAKFLSYLTKKYKGKSLEDFALPGTHHLELEYWEQSLAKETDIFLERLGSIELAARSSWEVDILDSGIWRGNSTLLSNILRKLPSIKSLAWRKGEPIPLDILQFLEEKHPSCQLHYELDFEYAGPEHDPEIPREPEPNNGLDPFARRAKRYQAMAVKRESILNSTILYSLKARVWNGGNYYDTSAATRDPSKMDMVSRILSSCPNLKRLDLSISWHGGCVIRRRNDPFAFDFTSSNGTLAPLESLTIDGYDWGAKPNGQPWKEWETDHPKRDILHAPWKYMPDSVINYFGYSTIKDWGGLQTTYGQYSPLKPGTKTNLDIWLERMDWTHLQTLKIRGGLTGIAKLLGRDVLPKLRNVEFSGLQTSGASVLAFLSNTSSHLESIQFNHVHFHSLSEAINTIVEHHGSSLHTFVLQNSQWCSNAFLDVENLTHLRDHVPGLSKLDLDIRVTEEWDYEILDTLASFGELENLALRFKAEDAIARYKEFDRYAVDEDEDYEVKTRENFYLMSGLKEYLRKQKVGKPWKGLETWVGGALVIEGT